MKFTGISKTAGIFLLVPFRVSPAGRNAEYHNQQPSAIRLKLVEFGGRGRYRRGDTSSLNSKTKGRTSSCGAEGENGHVAPCFGMYLLSHLYPPLCFHRCDGMKSNDGNLLEQSKIVDDDPLCWLDFTKDGIVTSCKSGHVRTWSRPSDDSSTPSQSQHGDDN